MNKRDKRKFYEESLRQRAFELRQMTGRGWTREELKNDKVWAELNNELEALNKK